MLREDNSKEINSVNTKTHRDESSLFYTSTQTGRNDPVDASGPLKHKKPLCIIR